MSKRFLTNRAGLAALVTIVWALLMTGAERQYPYPHSFQHDVDSPVLALEVSRDAVDIDAVLHRSRDNRPEAAAASMATVNRLDLVFIPLYGFSIWALARVFARRTRLLTFVILTAMLFDYLEDWQIFHALEGANPPIYIAALAKWGLLGFVFIMLGGIMLASTSPVYTLSTKRLLAIGYFVAGVLVIVDVAGGNWLGYSHLELAMSVFGLLFVVNLIGLLGHYLAIPPIKHVFVENFCQERRKARDGNREKQR